MLLTLVKLSLFTVGLVLGSPVNVQLERRATCASTAGIKPLPIHSHNDYTRNVPLCDALNNSASSIEADVWWTNNILYVAHTSIEKNPSKTLDSLYVQPLLNLLEAQNPNGVQANVKPKGLFKSSPETTLQLLIDFKTGGADTFNAVVNALKPLADAGYLTKFENGVLKESAITVVGSGETPFDLVQVQNPRTIFYDAPLNNLASNPQYTKEVAPLASADFVPTIGWIGILPISSSARSNIKKYFADAHARGIKTRFYGTPDYLKPVMKQIWKELLDDGTDWLNADHLTTARDYYLDWVK